MSNMVVNTNVLALNAHRNMKNVGASQSTSSSRLSSGLRINSAADDAAGLAISEKMRSQIKGLNQASRNSQDGISLLQTAEGGLTEINNMVQRTRELTVQAANGTNTAEDREKITSEINQLASEVMSMVDRVEFNGMKLLDKSQLSNVSFQVGANSTQLTKVSFSYDLKANVADIMLNASKVIEGSPFIPAIKNGGKSVGTHIPSVAAIIPTASSISLELDKLSSALKEVTEFRATLGASQNRLEYTIKSLDTSSENLSQSESRVRDADMGKEMMNLTKSNVLQQAAMSMLTQANQAPNGVLSLLR